MTTTRRYRGWQIALVAGCATCLAAPATQDAKTAAPAPDETPVAVVNSAAAAQAAIDKARASGQGIVADLSLGHGGKIVRAKTTEPQPPGRYRLHALVATNARDHVLGEAVALRLEAGGNHRGFDPKAGSPEPGKLASVSFDFILEQPGRIDVAADWNLGEAPESLIARRQNAINKMGLQGGPGKAGATPDDDGLGDALEELEAKEPQRLAARPLAGQGLPPHRLVLAGLTLERLSPVAQVRVDGRECGLHYTRLGRPDPPEGLVRIDGREQLVTYNPAAAIVGFDVAQPVRVEIECTGTVQSVDVRPKALGIRPDVAGNTITFPLSAPACLSVEINGDSTEPLFLFADPPEENAPKPDAPGVRFFAAGKIHEAGTVTVKSGETVYIGRGAVVRGALVVDDVKNVTIRGRGILDGGVFEPAASRTIQISRAADVLVEGITILDSRHWAVPILRSDRVTLRRVKIVSDNDWDDGVVVVGSRDVTIEKCFIRTMKSCVAVKAGGVTYFTELDCQRDVENVTVRDCVLWSGVRGHGLEISSHAWPGDWVGKKAGFVPLATAIRTIRLANNDLIHSTGPGAALAIHVRDPATVGDVTQENFRAEDLLGPLVDFKILPSPYDRNAKPGSIRDVVLRNIRAAGQDVLPSELAGLDETHRIEGVVFENVEVGGRKWTTLQDSAATATFTTGVEIR